MIRIEIDLNNNTGTLDLVSEGEQRFNPEEAATVLTSRESSVDLKPHPALPLETKFWAALQAHSGGTWGGCVYDVEALLERLEG